MNNAEVTPQKGLPQAESHKSVDSASQGGYQWQFANCEQRYATSSEEPAQRAQNRRQKHVCFHLF